MLAALGNIVFVYIRFCHVSNLQVMCAFVAKGGVLNAGLLSKDFVCFVLELLSWGGVLFLLWRFPLYQDRF
ncbi:hypothetical protein L195_g008995 [Trifolium pratense]|uniref:Uncharacterized protein n=1 Tax=Trifolium pratense TaxID=57577 RepID=A0A2K3PAP2_TRIPR|nr:hypothetical protein L195_g004777 [Trifolium pratense]PNY12366.1 hypothetical protein L195_g008995 [Trifolium pratense]